MKDMTVSAALAVAALGAAVLGYSDSTRHGQVVLIPRDATLGGAAGVSADAVVTACDETRDGLSVRIHVEPVGPPVVLAVWPTEATQPGIRVGTSFAAGAGLLVNADVGDVAVVLPWASLGSRFAVLETDSRTGMSRRGPMTSCPESE